MKRVPILFLVLAVTGGCMLTEPDRIEDPPYASPRRLAEQAQAWSYQPQSTKAAVQKTNAKAENTLVKAAYTETKPAQEESPPVTLGILRLTNSKRLTFHYESSDAAPAGAANLEIWGTTDMRTWKKYEAMSHSPSSLAVEVQDEGLYGFTMIARSKDQPATEQPPAGEPPQVLVAVDLTKPAVQLLDAEMNIQTQTPGLVVRWDAKDRNFGPQPITVLYAERPDGPWRPLAANLENSGRYQGLLPPHLADKVYVRVQAADLMGNIGMSKTTVLHLPSQSANTKTGRMND
jgi:hypothetical protein